MDSMKIEVRIGMRPFIAIIRAGAPTTRRVFVAGSLNAPPIIANVQELARP
jgi:hypothetical protein